MNLATQPASRPAHGLFLVAGDAGGVLMNAHNGRVNHLHEVKEKAGRRTRHALRAALQQQKMFCSAADATPFQSGRCHIREALLRAVITLILAVLACVPARANDSTAALATGGLVFVRNPDVEMRAEDLFISAAEIRVRYRSFNKATHDMTTLVAFPMPEIEGDALSEGDVAIPTDDPENILGFSTNADGHPVTTRVEQRVRAQSIDRTDMLRGLGIPLLCNQSSRWEPGNCSVECHIRRD
jgi:hypothetical protein